MVLALALAVAASPLAMASDTLRAEGLRGWSAEIASLRPSEWGRTLCAEQVVQVDAEVLPRDELLRETIAHEVAHALITCSVRLKGNVEEHGPEWRAAFKRIHKRIR